MEVNRTVQPRYNDLKLRMYQARECAAAASRSDSAYNTTIVIKYRYKQYCDISDFVIRESSPL